VKHWADWTHVANHTLVNCPEYLWELDEYCGPNDEQMLFAHIKILRITPSLLKRMRETYRQFRHYVQAPLFAVGETDDDKWERFISYFGFKYLQDVICVNGEKRRLFVSLNKEQKEHGVILPRHKQERLRQHHPEPVGPAGRISTAGL
jgi:hypothetical protein